MLLWGVAGLLDFVRPETSLPTRVQIDLVLINFAPVCRWWVATLLPIIASRKNSTIATLLSLNPAAGDLL